MDDQILIIDDEDLPQSAPRPAGWKVMIMYRTLSGKRINNTV
ncbi:hypothetical protein [Aeromonas caviae]|nr:hypothetical protein [Aeromonas caviae]